MYVGGRFEAEVCHPGATGGSLHPPLQDRGRKGFRKFEAGKKQSILGEGSVEEGGTV